jgi:hypothetical protein
MARFVALISLVPLLAACGSGIGGHLHVVPAAVPAPSFGDAPSHAEGGGSSSFSQPAPNQPTASSPAGNAVGAPTAAGGGGSPAGNLAGAVAAVAAAAAALAGGAAVVSSVKCAPAADSPATDKQLNVCTDGRKQYGTSP